MDSYAIASAILTLAVIIAYLNHRFIKMQSTIAIMVASLCLSLILLLLQHTGIANIVEQTKTLVMRTDFHRLLLHGMLGFLLFAGSLTVDFNLLRSQKWEIGTLASVSTIISAFLIGILIFYLLPLLGLSLPFLYCLLFGALISPTDPIAVLATFKEVGAPKKLEVCVAGESLFNDGVGIVIFVTLSQLVFSNTPVTFSNVAVLFLQQAIGGIGYGIILGVITHALIKKSDHKMAILVTLAVVTGGYTLALSLNISGALAMVVAGIFVGNKVRKESYEDKHLREALHTFWEVIDEVLNTILFLLIGFELLAIKASHLEIIAAICTVPLVLFIRLITVAVPMKFFQLKKSHGPYTISILTWGGLRGGLAVALALSLPPSGYRNIILALTYAVVAFAVIVQGVTIKPLAKLAREKA